MNEALSLKSYQVNWEACRESVPEEHGQSCGHGRRRRGAEGTQVNHRPNRLALQAELLEQCGKRVQIRNPKNWKRVSGANMASVEDTVAFWILTCLGLMHLTQPETSLSDSSVTSDSS